MAKAWIEGRVLHRGRQTHRTGKLVFVNTGYSMRRNNPWEEIMKVARHVILVLAVALLLGCASTSRDSVPSGGSGSAGATTTPPPAGSPLSKVQLGMNDAQVRKAIGEPDNSNAYMTGKAWIPFYFGPDTHRSDWFYNGQGRVVFSRNRWSGGMKVIRISYEPDTKM